MTTLSQAEKIQRGGADAGHYFRQMVEFVGFTPSDAQAIRESALVIEKHIPNIVADFYSNLLRYPPTRKYFIHPDGSLNEDYVQKRMHHLTNFWRRTASGVYDDDYARYVDYVGRAHTSHGADPTIYIEERYVIGQVGFMQHAISKAISAELHEYNPDLERRAIRAWNLLMMVILEVLARAYSDERMPEEQTVAHSVDRDSVHGLAVDAYEQGLGLLPPRDYKEVFVAPATEIPDGTRTLIDIDGVSIGVFHHDGTWYALRNHCLHAGGPVAAGPLQGNTLTCPWHGFQYNVTTGELLVDPASKLEMYMVVVRDDNVYVSVPEVEPAPDVAGVEEPEFRQLAGNEFYTHAVAPGETGLVFVNGRRVAVYNVDGTFYATDDACTHVGGPLSDGRLDDATIVCPWHASCFNVMTGAVTCGPATEPVETYTITIDGDIGRVE